MKLSKIDATIGLILKATAASIIATQISGGIRTAKADVPRNPERPMQATSCKEALQRIKEAARGSALIDAKQNRKHLLDAVTQAERLCLHKNPE